MIKDMPCSSGFAMRARTVLVSKKGYRVRVGSVEARPGQDRISLSRPHLTGYSRLR